MEIKGGQSNLPQKRSLKTKRVSDLDCLYKREITPTKNVRKKRVAFWWRSNAIQSVKSISTNRAIPLFLGTITARNLSSDLETIALNKATVNTMKRVLLGYDVAALW